ncbi:MAG TPA: glycosyltransferase family 1 protein [Hanamia sp.]|jgi:glycosyltransferase involved in cell wall biosynthesis|nr:glycosyltransferase family 1 protein [Hanamia sp.]
MDLICLSHIRWNFVYQRPQHLLNRFAVNSRVFVIEEPVFESEYDFYEISKPDDNANLWVVILHVAKNTTAEKRNHTLRALLDSCMYSNKIHKYILWYYSPMALAYTDHLYPSLIIYDCMDELSAFKSPPPQIKEMEACLLSSADLVFTGGQSLYKAKRHLHHNIHSFPSSIDKSHFSVARNFKGDPPDQASISHPRFGFYGVIDERFDIPLIEQLSALRPDWQFVFLGPITKIDPANLPKKENIHYLGSKKYKELPVYLSGWDVAILPFALNESTKFISPTKTPEYLAGGKPVISTSITDVVTPYGKEGLVHIADTATEFIEAAEQILSNKDKEAWNKKVDAFLKDISWNKTWHKMSQLIDEALERKAMMNNNKTINNNKSEVYV